MRLQIAKSYPLPLPLWPIPRVVITYAQVTKKPPHDPEKGAHDPEKVLCDVSHDQTGSKPSCDYAHDPEKPTHDQPKDWSATQLPASIRFGHAMCLLIGMWKTMGTIKDSQRINKSCFHCTN